MEEKWHFVEHWAQHQYCTGKNTLAPAATLHLPGEGSLRAHKHCEKIHFHSHHLFNLPTEHEDSNRKYCLESACLRVLANSYNLRFLFSNTSAQSCSLLYPSTIFDLNSLTSIRKLMNKQETSISNNLFETNRSKSLRQWSLFLKTNVCRHLLLVRLLLSSAVPGVPSKIEEYFILRQVMHMGKYGFSK